MGLLDLKIDDYSSEFDLTKQENLLEWTISEKLLKEIKGKYQQVLKDSKKVGAKRASIETLKKDVDQASKKPKIKAEIKTEIKKEEPEECPEEEEELVQKEDYEAAPPTDATNGDHSSNCDSNINSKSVSEESEENMDNENPGSIRNSPSEDSQSQSARDILSSAMILNGDKTDVPDNGELNIKGRSEDEVDSGFSETPDEI